VKPTVTDDDVQARIAAQLRELRAAAVLGGIEAGRQARISQSKISKLERQLLRPDPDDVAALCDEREVQLRDRVPHAVLIMTEGSLRWPGCGPQVMLDQIEAISAAIGLPDVEIGIIPFSASAAGIFPRHGFHLYDSDAVIWGSESGTATSPMARTSPSTRGCSPGSPRSPRWATLPGPRSIASPATTAASSDTAPCLVTADRDRLSRMLVNLVDNAVRYAKSAVTVSVSRSAGRATWCGSRSPTTGPGYRSPTGSAPSTGSPGLTTPA
jgi:signal transduction histidine kinase